MTDAEILSGLRALDRIHPFVGAVEAMHADLVRTCTEMVAQPNLTTEQRHFNAGRLALALDWVASFDGAMQQAHTKPE